MISDDDKEGTQQVCKTRTSKNVSGDHALATPETRAVTLRSSLRRNKIFFETVAASLLSLMAVIISVAQIFISVKQNALTSMQAEIARAQAMPQFVIAARQVMDSLTGKVREDAIDVNNRGGIVRDLLCNTAVFFNVELTSQSGNGKKEELPVNGYYGSTMYTAEGTGQVLQIQGYLNHERLSKLRENFMTLAYQNKSYANVEVRRYLRLYYTDILGKEHVDYYYVPIIYGGSRIDWKKRR